MDKKFIKKILIRVLLSIVLFLAISIFINYSDANLLFFKRNIYDKSFSFSTFNNLYKRYFGEVLPDSNIAMVSRNILTYSEANKFHDGAKLSDVSVVTPFKSGIVVFIGEKETYGNTIIIQGMDGIDYWYANVENVAVKIYDYIESDNIIASAKNNELYILFMKNGEVLDFEEFI